MTGRYDLYSLTLFLAVASCRNIAQAAAAHNIAASAVSRRIAELETQVGTALLYRQQRGVALTLAGQEMHRIALGIQRQIAQLDAAMGEFADGLKGIVRIAANTSAITQFLPEDLAAFTSDYPQIRIKLVELFSSEVLNHVRTGASDLGICSGLIPVDDLDKALYRRDTLVLVVPKGHRLVGRASIKLDEIAGEDLVSLQEGSSIQAFIEARAQDSGFQLRTRVQVMSFDGVRKMVEARLGVAILPYGTVANFLGVSDLGMVAIDEPWAKRDLWVVAKKEQDYPNAARILLRYLTGEVSAAS